MFEKTRKTTKSRYWILDALRTLCLISMIAYHTVWDCVYIFGAEWTWFYTKWEFLWQQSICWGFILLAGFCFGLSRHPYKHALLVEGGGLLITVVTLLFMPKQRVIFGVLTFLGSAMLLTALTEKGLKKVPSMAGLIGSFCLFLVTYNCREGFLGFAGKVWITLPESWYSNYVTTFLGFPANWFFSTDYFPIFPWIFLFLTGYYGYVIVQKKGWLAAFQSEKISILTWPGRHSMLVYLLHQPIVYGVLWLVFSVR